MSQPWQKSSYNSFGIIRLHEELTEFCNYIKPTLLEEKVRNSVVEKVTKVILGRWPSADVEVFGSFATGLYLPTSDIDIVVFGNWDINPLWTIDKLLRDSGISSNIKVIDKATVPIVKFVDYETGINVDISFNKDNGVKSVPVINGYIVMYPNLKKLFLVLKQFMLQRDLNEVFTGGMGSYCLMLMCISFLQQYNKNITGPTNLGCILMEFFELYGRSFNFMHIGISVKGKGSYRTKYDSEGQRSSMLSIDDPIDESDVARSCYGLFNIRSAFANAYCKLYSKVVPSCITVNNGSADIPHNDSILSSILSVGKDMIQFRDNIRNKFGHLVNHDRKKMDFDQSILSDNAEEAVPKSRRDRKIKKMGVRQERRQTLPKKMNKAHNWSDLNEWSQENVFKCK